MFHVTFNRKHAVCSLRMTNKPVHIVYFRLFLIFALHFTIYSFFKQSFDKVHHGRVHDNDIPSFDNELSLNNFEIANFPGPELNTPWNFA